MGRTMSAHEPMAVRPEARARAGLPMDAAVDTAIESARSTASCAQCGREWFGEVAYCPYCGRPSASAPEDRPQVHDAPAAPPTPLPRASKWAPGKSALAAAAALAATAIVVGLALMHRDGPAPQGARRVPALAPAPAIARTGTDARAAVPPAAPAPAAAPAVRRADVEQPRQPPAPPAPHRSLCSAANEAAGLCNPQ